MSHSKTDSLLHPSRRVSSTRLRFNPVRQMAPESLVRIIDSFNAGDLRAAALLWEALEQRDDVLKSVALRRKRAPGRFGWIVEREDDSDEARRQEEALDFFYRNLTATNAFDLNETGGFSLLARQMMDAVGKRYAVHEILWNAPEGQKLTATFQFVPLWFFENRSGRLRFLKSDTSREGIPLEPGCWLVTTGEGLMVASSIACLYKHLPLKDWLLYCERNGTPGVRGVTNAPPDSAEWNAALDAVKDFGADFRALMSEGTRIEPIDLASKGELPYPRLIERVDNALVTLWGSFSLGGLSQDSTGVSLQLRDARLVERDDIEMLNDTLHTQVDRQVIAHVFGKGTGVRARLRIRHTEDAISSDALPGIREAVTQSLPQAIADFIRQLLSTTTNRS